MIRATSTTTAATGSLPADTVTLAHDDRYRRRMAMSADGGLAFLLDLPRATALRDGDLLVLEDGRTVRVAAADEPVMEVRPGDGDSLARIAWHVGNRHWPCEIRDDRLVLREDAVIGAMLEGLGCSVVRARAPFQPEGGAYAGHVHDRAHADRRGAGHGHDHD